MDILHACLFSVIISHVCSNCLIIVFAFTRGGNLCKQFWFVSPYLVADNYALFLGWVFKNPFGPQPETAHMQYSQRYFCNAPFPRAASASTSATQLWTTKTQHLLCEIHAFRGPSQFCVLSWPKSDMLTHIKWYQTVQTVFYSQKHYFHLPLYASYSNLLFTSCQTLPSKMEPSQRVLPGCFLLFKC